MKIISFAFFVAKIKGLANQPLLRLVPLVVAQTQSSIVQVWPTKLCVPVSRDCEMLQSPTGLRPETLVAMSLGVIFCFSFVLVNQMQRTPIRCKLVYEGYSGI